MQVIEQISGALDIQKQEPLRVSVMGQTGVGKSSLINALFGTNLPTDPVRPGTINICPYETHGKNNHSVIFYDFPGIGETAQNGKEWIPKYREYLRESDVAIWAVVADTRSFMLDQMALEELMDKEKPEEKTALLSKIVFALTKIDHLTHPRDPIHWLAAKAPNSKDDIILVPDATLTKLIKQKEAYFETTFMEHFKSFITAQTYHKGRFKVDISGMHCKDGIVYYNHYVDEEKREEWSKRYPEHAEVFRRLRESCSIIPCSALFQYNLDLLMNVIIAKLDARSTGRFGGFVEQKPMDRIPHLDVKRLINIIFLDAYEGFQLER